MTRRRCVVEGGEDRAGGVLPSPADFVRTAETDRVVRVSLPGGFRGQQPDFAVGDPAEFAAITDRGRGQTPPAGAACRRLPRRGPPLRRPAGCAPAHRRAGELARGERARVAERRQPKGARGQRDAVVLVEPGDGTAERFFRREIAGQPPEPARTLAPGHARLRGERPLPGTRPALPHPFGYFEPAEAAVPRRFF